MDGSSLLFFRHASTHQLDERVLQRGFALLQASNLAARAFDDPHDAPQCGVAGEEEGEPVDAVLLGDAGPGNAVDLPQRVEQETARAQLNIDARILLDLLLELGLRAVR